MRTMSAWRRRSSMNVCGKRISGFQFDLRRASAALVLRGRRKPRDMRMIVQEFSDRLAECASAVAVNYAHFGEAVQESFVEKLIREFNSFVGCLANQIQFGICLES